MKSKKKKTKKAKRPATKTHLPISEIKEGVLVLKDGTTRAVLLTSSINFALKSEDEQNALISSYVGFLNSIDFPLQIVVQSRRLQIRPYLEELASIEAKQKNELLRIQIADYRAFVKELVDIGQIMTKRYYVVVPYDPLSNTKKSFFSRTKDVLRPMASIRLKEDRFRQRKEDLDMRVRQVISGLSSVGVTAVQLDTQALIELYYSTFNPDISYGETMSSVEDLQVERGL
ncbi:MAG: hypothetical protein HYY51_04875 [Candidatus Magasanikbacteria bacterium]|nr:hypothetical protein [Candidatus Magasanikbacteria bacterium]